MPSNPNPKSNPKPIPNSKVYTTGAGGNGRLGHGQEESCTLPKLIKSLDEAGIVIQQVAAGGNHIAAIDWDGKCYSWGYNLSGQLGHGHQEIIFNPLLIKSISDIVMEQVGAGESHTAFCSSKGEVYTCGWGVFGGHGSTANVTRPTLVKVMKPNTNPNPNPTLVKAMIKNRYLNEA